MHLLSGSFFLMAVFFTSALSGIFGMAGGLLLLWFLLLLFPATAAIAVHGVIQFSANFSRAWISRRYIVWPIVLKITVGVITAAGILLVVNYTPDNATISLAIGLMPLLVWAPTSWFKLDASRTSHALGCGFTAGGLTIAAGVSGPLIDIFFIRTHMGRRQIVATKAAIQVISHFIKTIFYVSALTLSKGEWGMVLLAAPLAVIGTGVGNYILMRMTDANFRSLSRWIVTAIGVFYFIQWIMLVSSG
ncbi:sulfite exporter TauE/SafE family protein [Halomonas daqingensis]|uniref:Probable membrane transporter protein n=1 Tax=Billgrantia desiderata TaxID=52021 RepID=A0ABS9B4Q9_9GAMM|nr:sulfite exporter TauE/SafE family protein [Halomonas desiderata]MCE8042309.1 sulfite exporter TauE/SafE family protein [Halomonas desiderata]MCE8046884.1 sulfite exporter TauE/SafE family protein [Halomonas desiderata]